MRNDVVNRRMRDDHVARTVATAELGTKPFLLHDDPVVLPNADAVEKAVEQAEEREGAVDQCFAQGQAVEGRGVVAIDGANVCCDARCDVMHREPEVGVQCVAEFFAGDVLEAQTPEP